MNVYSGHIEYGDTDDFAQLRAHILNTIKCDLVNPQGAWPDIARVRHDMKQQYWADLIRSCLPINAKISSPVLRCSAPNQHLPNAHSIHRDTWYGYPAHAINVWVPVFGHTPNNGMHIYPQYFQQAVRNNSHAFDEHAWRNNDNPVFPVCLDDMSEAYRTPLYDKNCFYYMFSAQHLHATTPNFTSARWSVDFRILIEEDEHKGPILVDNRSAPAQFF